MPFLTGKLAAQAEHAKVDGVICRLAAAQSGQRKKANRRSICNAPENLRIVIVPPTVGHS
jgi:hypothetical protein